MPDSVSHRKRVRCNRFDNVTGEALTLYHKDDRDAETCRFAHPCQPDWIRAETALTRFSNGSRSSLGPSSSRRTTQDSESRGVRVRSSSPPLVLKCIEPTTPTPETSTTTTDNKSLAHVQNTTTSSSSSSSGTEMKASTSSTTSKQPSIKKTKSQKHPLSKYFDIEPLPKPSRDLSNGDGNKSKSKWKPIGPNTTSTESGKTTTDTSDAGNSQRNVLSTPTGCGGTAAMSDSAASDMIISGQGSDSEQCEGAGTAPQLSSSSSNVIDEKQIARASIRFSSILKQLAGLVITRQSLAADSRHVADWFGQLSDGHTEAHLDTVNLNQQLRDCTTNIDGLLLKLLDPAEVVASEDVESLAARLKEYLAPDSSERSASVQDAGRFIQAHNEAVISGISGPLASLQGKCEKTLQVVTERQRATSAQQQERLEDWSETVQKELDAVELADKEHQSAFEKASLSAIEAATQANAERREKLRRNAELDDECGSLERENEELVRRLNDMEAAHAEIRDSIRAVCGAQEAPSHGQEVEWLRNHPLARVPLDIQKAHDEGWNEILKLQREHASSQMNVLFRDFRTAMERSNILTTLAARWIQSQSQLVRVPRAQQQNAARQ